MNELYFYNIIIMFKSHTSNVLFKSLVKLHGDVKEKKSGWTAEIVQKENTKIL